MGKEWEALVIPRHFDINKTVNGDRAQGEPLLCKHMQKLVNQSVGGGFVK